MLTKYYKTLKICEIYLFHCIYYIGLTLVYFAKTYSLIRIVDVYTLFCP